MSNSILYKVAWFSFTEVPHTSAGMQEGKGGLSSRFRSSCLRPHGQCLRVAALQSQAGAVLQPALIQHMHLRLHVRTYLLWQCCQSARRPRRMRQAGRRPTCEPMPRAVQHQCGCCPQRPAAAQGDEGLLCLLTPVCQCQACSQQLRQHDKVSCCGSAHGCCLQCPAACPGATAMLGLHAEGAQPTYSETQTRHTGASQGLVPVPLPVPSWLMPGQPPAAEQRIVAWYVVISPEEEGVRWGALAGWYQGSLVQHAAARKQSKRHGCFRNCDCSKWQTQCSPGSRRQHSIGGDKWQLTPQAAEQSLAAFLGQPAPDNGSANLALHFLHGNQDILGVAAVQKAARVEHIPTNPAKLAAPHDAPCSPRASVQHKAMTTLYRQPHEAPCAGGYSAAAHNAGHAHCIPMRRPDRCRALVTYGEQCHSCLLHQLGHIPLSRVPDCWSPGPPNSVLPCMNMQGSCHPLRSGTPDLPDRHTVHHSWAAAPDLAGAAYRSSHQLFCIHFLVLPLHACTS